MNVAACPTCSQRVSYTEQQAGRQVKCPNCQTVLILPGPTLTNPVADPLLGPNQLPPSPRPQTPRPQSSRPQSFRPPKPRPQTSQPSSFGKPRKKKKKSLNPEIEMKARIGGIIMAVVFFVVVVSGACMPESKEKFIEAFGERPMGLPVLVFFIGLFTLLYIPAPYIFYHGMLISMYLQKHEGWVGIYLFGLMRHIFVNTRKYPELKLSKLVQNLGLVYYLIVVFSWIAYASSKGI